MNREIKFRAWDKKLKLFDDELFLALHGKLYDHAKEVFDTPNIEIDYVDSKSRYELMQFTGLKDKNGTEIYEGDIFWDAHNEDYGKVLFEDGGFVVIWLTHQEDLCADLLDYHTVVSGNIYENPELLERDTND